MAYELTDVERKAWGKLAGNRTFPEGLEFADDAGRTYASLAIASDQLWVLHYRPVKVA